MEEAERECEIAGDHPSDSADYLLHRRGGPEQLSQIFDVLLVGKHTLVGQVTDGFDCSTQYFLLLGPQPQDDVSHEFREFIVVSAHQSDQRGDQVMRQLRLEPTHQILYLGLGRLNDGAILVDEVGLDELRGNGHEGGVLGEGHSDDGLGPQLLLFFQMEQLLEYIGVD